MLPEPDKSRTHFMIKSKSKKRPVSPDLIKTNSTFIMPIKREDLMKR
jgi:hypothetical protein